MAKFSEQQAYENHVLFQQVEKAFTPAIDWQDCINPLTTDEMLEKVNEELGIYFCGDASLIIKVMEELKFPYLFNEFNSKKYWLINLV